MALPVRQEWLTNFSRTDEFQVLEASISPTGDFS